MNKEDEKKILQCVKKIAKQNGYKVISNCIYKIDCNWVVYAVIWLNQINDDYSVVFRWCVKTMELDNIFWDVFDMSENKEKKLSLRITGAFCCPSYKFNEKAYIIENVEEITDNINSIFDANMKMVDDYVKYVRANYSDFLSYIVNQKDADDLTKILAYILMGKYKEVYKFVKNELKLGKTGGFENHGKDIYEFICKYCRRKARRTSGIFFRNSV